MANVRSGNSFYVDSASSANSSQSYIAQTQTLVTEIVFTSNATGDALVICDVAPGTTPAQGANKITVKNNLANDTKVLRFYDTPVLFPNGIWIASISSGAVATLIGTSQGSG